MARRCEICSLDLIDEYSFHGHLLGKKHLRNVDLEKLKTKKEQNSIFVSPLPQRAQTNDIIEFFTKYGPIHYYKFGPRYVIIEFKNKKTADEVLSKKVVYFNNWKLTIIPRKIITPQQNKAEKSRKQSTSDDGKEDEESFHDKLRLELEAEPTFESQLTKFLSLVQKDDNVLEESCDKVCISLNRVFRSSFPYCKALRFGSTVTGLHFKDSDMDVFLDIGEPINDTLDTNESGTHNLKWTSKRVFREAKAILFRNPAIFNHVIPIPLARIPIIKFDHIPTKTNCDLSFKHGFGVHNSLLIKYFLSLNPKLRPLMMIIKYWAKILDITGTNKITNYSLIMLIIFYLQQPDVNLLPTLTDLQSSGSPVFASGWRIDFNRYYKHETENNSTIPELLHGFLKFYSEFNFSLNLITPLDGIIHPRINYNEVAYNLGINIESLNLSKPVCIQDPMELDLNIANSWNERLLLDFQKHCAETVKLCEDSALNDNKSLLPSLLNPEVKHKSKKPKSIHIVIPAGKFEDFGLPDDFEQRDDIDNKQKYKENHWFSVVYKLIQRIFENIFKLNIHVTYDETNIKQIKLDQESDVHTNENNKIMLLCNGNYCLSRTRKGRLSSNLDPTLSCIDKEILISDKILEGLKEKKEETMIKFTCILEKKTNPLHVFITITDAQDSNKAFSEIGNYMRSKIPTIIDKEFLHMIQYKKTIV
ncbi:speckle targeted PIP5K1A-regulated poly(A) polymerase-like [Cotesia glomerata]|uniref:Speckle targeted PIP5K1A-regulated poly(A) polymerase n=1 Tax=Cotesia glomerata TaxID=32391 RepID=A0AAV7INL0_COTGL|nr:speckle targeted PIP5K1A-regulated poly(A) polymerase-like [Cotesia glomerata]KAH0554181.1 hypothetical protein KQX54_008379 [Cotesia glomerata]